MKNITCIIQKDRVGIFRDGKMIGIVAEVRGEPVLTLSCGYGVSSIQLSFNDLAIIEDNWNQMKEMVIELDNQVGHDTIGL